MARNLAPFTAFVCLPTVITGPGRYVTRAGEVVTVEAAATAHAFNCRGTYSCGTREAWHKSGRLYFGQQCNNDIVAACV